MLALTALKLLTDSTVVVWHARVTPAGVLQLLVYTRVTCHNNGEQGVVLLAKRVSTCRLMFVEQQRHFTELTRLLFLSSFFLLRREIQTDSKPVKSTILYIYTTYQNQKLKTN